MKNSQVQTGYNYLVLIDFSAASFNALKYAISLAKLINGNIHICHIGNPSRIVKKDNQVAALRALNSEVKKIEKKIGAIVEMIVTEGVNAIPHCSIGNIIYEFKALTNLIQPDLIIIGKKLENLKLSGKITGYLMNEYIGSLLIVRGNSMFQNNTKISVAYNENSFECYDSKLVFSLNNQTQYPLKLLSIKKSNAPLEKIKLTQKLSEASYEIDQNIQLEQHSTITDGLILNIITNKTELLCIGRGKPRNLLQRITSNRPKLVSDIVHKIDTHILIMGNNAEFINQKKRKEN
jgi:nucleotide-binding universal stress UspA family protein